MYVCMDVDTSGLNKLLLFHRDVKPLIFIWKEQFRDMDL